ncbi:hypothetical protein ACFQZS_15225 [Mucilaginibacter calamicampi]|uniref:Lipocalin-like domain-containing protein n=1 Tax=Mucilaginibacter calamicampi TaxID=1302352 RepID=A0ABW2YYQ6_9SPHI
MKPISLKNYSLILLSILLFSGCDHAVKTTDLYGKWNYIKIENPGQTTPGVSDIQLKQESPYIEFTKADSLRMFWGGKLLSHGTFTVDGTNIQYKEILADGSTRSFPFFISDFKDGKMVFETLGADASRVTVVKE